MPNDDRLKALLSDLGRATLRGVRKCPKCGTYNGTRGLICKNRACDVVFKEGGEKRKMSTEACKLITGTTTQVFSVRVRDKGPDYRGFVQLPVIQSADSADSLDTEAALITQTSALCFVDTCQRSFDASILKCHEKTGPLTPTTCQHIQAALRCYAEAQPLSLKNSVLNALNVSSDTRQAIWLLLSESAGPLVQRVSKNIMAVKCKASPKHPLGYLHFSFFMSRLKDRVENKYFCSCTAFKGQVKNASNKEDPTFKRCVHFYACIVAFGSDPKLSEEFSYYINLDKPPLTFSPSSSEHQQLVAILSDENGNGTVEVKVLQEEAALLEAAHIAVDDDVTIAEVQGLEVLTTEPIIQIHGMDSETLSFNEVSILTESSPELQPTHTAQQLELLSVKRKRDDHAAVAPLQEVGGKKPTSARKNNSSIGVRKQEPIDENAANITFIQWLASVTERINQAMHFQFSGKPDPLVFHVPQLFFDCLRERMSYGGRKKRLPNFTSGFIRRDAVPLGSFTKYTWQITNIIHVKHIFETPLMPLEITRSFVENHDGTYEPYHRKKDENEAFRKTDSQPLIKPLELKTFLKVGNMSPDQQEPTPFLIEWIPDILPGSKIGELRIRFEFGHQRNGQLDKRYISRTYFDDPESEISITRITDHHMLQL